MNKIFCIGLNKTGTTSLAQALEILGYRTVHHGSIDFGADLRLALRQNKPLFTYASRKLADADAWADVMAITRNYEVVDREFPGSKFILTTRPLDGWLDSRERHVQRNLDKVRRGDLRAWTTIDRPEWTRLWEEHHRGVLEYFAGRDNDFLVLNGNEGWDPLVEFLGVDRPDVAFPQVNVNRIDNVNQTKSSQRPVHPATVRLRRFVARLRRLAVQARRFGRIAFRHGASYRRTQ
jgi:hypothetical protein